MSCLLKSNVGKIIVVFYRFSEYLEISIVVTIIKTTLKREKGSWQCKAQYLASLSLSSCFDADDIVMLLPLLLMVMVIRERVNFSFRT